MEETIIRKGERRDAAAAHALVRELAVYERAPLEHTCTVEQFEEDGFGENSIYSLLVAEHRKEIVGICLFYTAYSTWKGKYIYLDDLMVTKSMRRTGIGEMLLERLFQEAREHGVAKVSWQVLDWNELAINFYKKYPVDFDGEWINCHMYKKDL